MIKRKYIIIALGLFVVMMIYGTVSIFIESNKYSISTNNITYKINNKLNIAKNDIIKEEAISYDNVFIEYKCIYKDSMINVLYVGKTSEYKCLSNIIVFSNQKFKEIKRYFVVSEMKINPSTMILETTSVSFTYNSSKIPFDTINGDITINADSQFILKKESADYIEYEASSEFIYIGINQTKYYDIKYWIPCSEYNNYDNKKYTFIIYREEDGSTFIAIKAKGWFPKVTM